ncbi:hypothetical protein EV424DRAFT_1544939 [Suillus variegatus]|nr:hypothetical protein EV424DRAFT_1544939 [Suillus variegatus]
MLCTFFVSPQPNHHTHTSGRCINQTFIGASTGLTFATTTPTTYPTSAIPGITGCYQSSTTFRFFIPFLLFSVFDLGGQPGAYMHKHILTGVLLSSRNPHAHTRHTQLAGKPKSSVRCPGEPQHSILCMRSSVLGGEHIHIIASPFLHVFPVHDPCDPRHAHAPPSLADEPTSTQL